MERRKAKTLDTKWTKLIPVFLFQLCLFNRVRRTFTVQYLHVISFPYCKMFCTLPGGSTGFFQNGRTRREKRTWFCSPKQTSKANWPENLGPVWQFHGSRAHCWMGKQTNTCFYIKKSITLIQEQDHFGFLFPNWSFPQSK